MEIIRYLYRRKQPGQAALDYNVDGHLTIDEGQTMLCGRSFTAEDWDLRKQSVIGYELCSACKRARADRMRSKRTKPHRPLAETISAEIDVKEFWLR